MGGVKRNGPSPVRIGIAKGTPLPCQRSVLLPHIAAMFYVPNVRHISDLRNKGE